VAGIPWLVVMGCNRDMFRNRAVEPYRLEEPEPAGRRLCWKLKRASSGTGRPANTGRAVPRVSGSAGGSEVGAVQNQTNSLCFKMVWSDCRFGVGLLLRAFLCTQYCVC
jgi:hypothetical protein